MFLSGSTTATASPFSLVKQSVEVVHATGQPYLGHILLATSPTNVGIYCFVKIFSQCGQLCEQQSTDKDPGSSKLEGGRL